MDTSMKIYADALEEWDDMIGENCEAPDHLFLDQIEWIKETKFILINQLISIRYFRALLIKLRCLLKDLERSFKCTGLIKKPILI